ncbi:MAG TPA: hypothetical protein P5081_10635 [Phycisphaerae bacterium]|nr:hypothetical protein [Phycisphaerae bacterium]HRW53334.1 hypothetical protein [Phycisphaerae bacterium]
MTSEELIVRVLGRRAALFARRSDDWQNGVLIAEIESRVELRTLLQTWRARPLPDEGNVRRYQLRGDLRCAVLDNTILLGPPGDPDGLWGRSVLLMTGRGPHLAGQSAYASLRSRLTEAPDALVFARWADDDPFAFAGCERLLTAIHFDGRMMRCSLYGRRRAAAPNEPTLSADLLKRLSDQSIGAWAGALEKPATTTDDPVAAAGPGAIVHQLLSKLPTWSAAGNSPLTTIDPCVLVQLGSLKTDDFQFPTISLTMRSEEAKEIADQLDRVLVLLTQMIAVFSTPRGSAYDIPDVERSRIDGGELRRIDLGRVLSRRKGLEFMRPMTLAWTADDSTIVVGTTASAVTDAVGVELAEPAPTRGLRTQLAIDAISDAEGEQLAEFGCLRGAPIAAMLASWMDFAEKQHPSVVSDAWWQVWIASKLAAEARLGVGMVDDASSPGRAIVSEISPTSPAAPFLRIGDAVVSVFGRNPPASSAARFIRDQYENRGAAQILPVEVIRDGVRMKFEIPVPTRPRLSSLNIRPITALRRVAALLSAVDEAAYVRVSSDPSHFDVRIRVRWASDTDARRGGRD